MTDRKLDLSALAPSQCFDARITTLVAQAMRSRQRRGSLLGHTQRWSRPALAMAVAAALVSWLGARQAPPSTSAEADPAGSLLYWATDDRVPSTAEVLHSLGAQHATR